MAQQSGCVFVSEFTQACVWRRPSLSPFVGREQQTCASVTACMHLMNMCLQKALIFKHIHDFWPVCASFFVHLQYWKVCIISLLATSKWRTTEFCSFCSSAGLLGDGWTGWHHQNASQACGRSLFWYFIYIPMLFSSASSLFMLYLEELIYLFSPLHEYKATDFFFRIQLKESQWCTGRVFWNLSYYYCLFFSVGENQKENLSTSMQSLILNDLGIRKQGWCLYWAVF